MRGRYTLKDMGFIPIAVDQVDKFLPMEKDGKLYLIHVKTKQALGGGPIESFEDNLNGVAFVIIKDGKRQLVSLNGKILSEPTVGKFTWRYEEGVYSAEDWPPNIIIENEKLDKRWYVNTKTGRIKETKEIFL